MKLKLLHPKHLHYPFVPEPVQAQAPVPQLMPGVGLPVAPLRPTLIYCVSLAPAILLRLTPASVASVARRRWMSGGTLTTNLPLYRREAIALGMCSSVFRMSATTSATTCRMPARAASGEDASRLRERGDNQLAGLQDLGAAGAPCMGCLESGIGVRPEGRRATTTPGLDLQRQIVGS